MYNILTYKSVCVEHLYKFSNVTPPGFSGSPFQKVFLVHPVHDCLQHSIPEGLNTPGPGTLELGQHFMPKIVLNRVNSLFHKMGAGDPTTVRVWKSFILPSNRPTVDIHKGLAFEITTDFGPSLTEKVKAVSTMLVLKPFLQVRIGKIPWIVPMSVSVRVTRELDISPSLLSGCHATFWWLFTTPVRCLLLLGKIKCSKLPLL